MMYKVKESNPSVKHAHRSFPLFSDKPQYDQEVVFNFNHMIEGDLSKVPDSLPKSIVRIFLSSTFSGTVLRF